LVLKIDNNVSADKKCVRRTIESKALLKKVTKISVGVFYKRVKRLLLLDRDKWRWIFLRLLIRDGNHIESTSNKGDNCEEGFIEDFLN
jgi:hypothetical protein